MLFVYTARVIVVNNRCIIVTLPLDCRCQCFSFPASISCFRMRHAHNTHAPSGTSSKSSMYILYTPGANGMVLGHDLESEQ